MATRCLSLCARVLLLPFAALIGSFLLGCGIFVVHVIIALLVWLVSTLKFWPRLCVAVLRGYPTLCRTEWLGIKLKLLALVLLPVALLLLPLALLVLSLCAALGIGMFVPMVAVMIAATEEPSEGLTTIREAVHMALKYAMFAMDNWVYVTVSAPLVLEELAGPFYGDPLELPLLRPAVAVVAALVCSVASTAVMAGLSLARLPFQIHKKTAEWHRRWLRHRRIGADVRAFLLAVLVAELLLAPVALVLLCPVALLFCALYVGPRCSYVAYKITPRRYAFRILPTSLHLLYLGTVVDWALRGNTSEYLHAIMPPEPTPARRQRRAAAGGANRAGPGAGSGAGADTDVSGEGPSGLWPALEGLCDTALQRALRWGWVPRTDVEAAEPYLFIGLPSLALLQLLADAAPVAPEWMPGVPAGGGGGAAAAAAAARAARADGGAARAGANGSRGVAATAAVAAAAAVGAPPSADPPTDAKPEAVAAGVAEVPAAKCSNGCGGAGGAGSEDHAEQLNGVQGGEGERSAKGDQRTRSDNVIMGKGVQPKTDEGASSNPGGGPTATTPTTGQAPSVSNSEPPRNATPAMPDAPSADPETGTGPAVVNGGRSQGQQISVFASATALCPAAAAPPPAAPPPPAPPPRQAGVQVRRPPPLQLSIPEVQALPSPEPAASPFAAAAAAAAVAAVGGGGGALAAEHSSTVNGNGSRIGSGSVSITVLHEVMDFEAARKLLLPLHLYVMEAIGFSSSSGPMRLLKSLTELQVTPLEMRYMAAHSLLMGDPRVAQLVPQMAPSVGVGRVSAAAAGAMSPIAALFRSVSTLPSPHATAAATPRSPAVPVAGTPAAPPDTPGNRFRAFLTSLNREAAIPPAAGGEALVMFQSAPPVTPARNSTGSIPGVTLALTNWHSAPMPLQDAGGGARHSPPRPVILIVVDEAPTPSPTGPAPATALATTPAHTAVAVAAAAAAAGPAATPAQAAPATRSRGAARSSLVSEGDWAAAAAALGSRASTAAAAALGAAAATRTADGALPHATSMRVKRLHALTAAVQSVATALSREAEVQGIMRRLLVKHG